MDVLTQSSLLVAIMSFGLGFSVLARNVKNKLFLAFAILTTLISAWALLFFMHQIWGQPGLYLAHLALNIWLGPAALLFIRLLVRAEDRISTTLLVASIVLSAIFSVALVFRGDEVPWIKQVIYFLPGTVVLQILKFILIQSPSIRPDRRFIVYLGGLLVLGTCVMDHAPWLGSAIPSIGNLLLTAYLFFMSQAISRQRFLNWGALFSRFLVLLAVALTLTLIYSMLFAWIEHKFALFFLNSFIVSFLLLMLLEPIRSMVSFLAGTLLSQKHQRLEQMLREAQRKIAGVTDPATLFQQILATAEQTLEPKWAALFALRSDGTRFRRARLVGDAPASELELREVLATHPLLEHCRLLREKGELPILLDQFLENEVERSASRKQREFFAGLREGLRALNANLLIPLFDSEQMLGFLILRAESPPEPWGNNWGLLPVLYPYFEQAARAMRSLEVYARQREKERLAELGEMAAGLAHEIRNPLGAIKGAAQFLDPEALNAQNRTEGRFLNIIIEEVDRLNLVVTQFLDYSKPLTADFASVDLVSLAAKTVELMKPSVPGGIELVFEPAVREAKVMASAGQIQQVLINLIQNSVKALEPASNPGKKERRVRVSVECDPDSVSPEAVISVEDTGHGIKRENIEKLFIPFFTTSPSGTGLGLSISQKIVEAHRGRIDVLTEEGSFTRFSVIIPAV